MADHDHPAEIVRSYWNDFLERHRPDVRGAALEVGTTSMIRAYGGDRLHSADAIDLAQHGPEVKLVADLSRADAVTGERLRLLRSPVHDACDRGRRGCVISRKCGC